MVTFRTFTSAAILQLGIAATFNISNAPVSWGVCSLAVWFSFLTALGWRRLTIWDRYQLVWALFSASAFLNFVAFLDPDFKVLSASRAACNSKLLQLCASKFGVAVCEFCKCWACQHLGQGTWDSLLSLLPSCADPQRKAALHQFWLPC